MICENEEGAPENFSKINKILIVQLTLTRDLVTRIEQKRNKKIAAYVRWSITVLLLLLHCP